MAPTLRTTTDRKRPGSGKPVSLDRVKLCGGSVVVRPNPVCQRSVDPARFVDHEIDLVIDCRPFDRMKPRDAEAFEVLLWAAGLRVELSLLLNENSVVSASLDAGFAVDWGRVPQPDDRVRFEIGRGAIRYSAPCGRDSLGARGSPGLTSSQLEVPS